MSAAGPIRVPSASALQTGCDLASPSTDEPVARLVVGGDLCPIGRAARLLEPGGSDIWSGIATLLDAADLSLANLECPLTDGGEPISKSGPCLSASPKFARAIASAGFDVLTLANNHLMDMGARGFADTMEACRDAGLKTVGAGVDLAASREPLFVDVNGLSLAILAFAENEFSIASSEGAGACPLDIAENYACIRDARSKADFVLVILHAGNEMYALPRPGMVKVCRFFAEARADAVVCHHSHVTSGVQVIKDVPIVYSTGNLLFDWPEPQSPSWHVGQLVELAIQSQRVVSLKLHPYRQFGESPGIVPLSGEELDSFFKEAERLCEIIASPSRLRREWKSFCKSVRMDYLSMLFARYPGEGNLFKRIPLLWRFWLTRRRMNTTLGLIRCESHREALVEILSGEDE